MSIKISHLTKVYAGGVCALDDLSMEIAPGTFGLLGPNGAGKTTLMRILATLIPPSRGEVTICGHSLAEAAAIRRILGYLPQTFGFYPQLSVYETLEYFAVLSQVRRSRAELYELLELVGLADFLRRPVHTLSGGMRQRLGIAVALVNRPRVLIVDEPTAGLDPEARVDFRNLLARLQTPSVILISTHIVADVETTCREIAVLMGGRLVFKGSPGELAARAAGRVYRLVVPLHRLSEVERYGRIVGIARDGDSAQVRLLAAPPALPGELAPMPVSPTTEDGYLYLMQSARGGMGIVG
ncbi:MAG: ABC transporter ATP-binding protein [Bacillota bacterium]